jgi:hypothetical protein
MRLCYLLPSCCVWPFSMLYCTAHIYSTFRAVSAGPCTYLLTTAWKLAYCYHAAIMRIPSAQVFGSSELVSGSPSALPRLGWSMRKRTCVTKGAATLWLHAPYLFSHTSHDVRRRVGSADSLTLKPHDSPANATFLLLCPTLLPLVLCNRSGIAVQTAPLLLLAYACTPPATAAGLWQC